MKLLITLLAAVFVLLGTVMAGCGGASKHAASVSHAAANAASVGTTIGGATSGGVATSGAVTSGVATSGAATGANAKRAGDAHYLSDGDYDPPDDSDGDNYADTEHDPFLDYKPDYSHRYHDPDDHGLLEYGHAASAEEERAVAGAVESYYAAAARGDGASACALLSSSLASAVVSDYGENGPFYLRSGKTCAAVLALLFKHYHEQLTAKFVVTDVRVEGAQAYALLGSTTQPANYIIVQREGAAWKMAQLLASENKMP